MKYQFMHNGLDIHGEAHCWFRFTGKELFDSLWKSSAPDCIGVYEEEEQ